MANEWLQSVPEEFRGEPSLAQINGKDWSEAGPVLVKNYVNSQKLIGADRMPAPKSDWGEKEWNDFFGKVGRPEKPEMYSTPEDIKLHGDLKFDDKKLGAAKAHFHKLGLSSRQAEGMLRYYAETLNGTVQEQEARQAAATAEASNKLRIEYGDKYDENIDIARSVLRANGDPELIEFLNTSRLGDHPAMVKMLLKIGKMSSEDIARGTGPGQMVSSATAGKQEIDKLSGDEEFQKALHSREHPGHKAALERWTHAFAIAYPGKQGE